MNQLTRQILPSLFFALISSLLLQACTPSEQNEEDGFRYRSALQPFTSCDELTDYLIETAQQESKLVDYYYALPVVVDSRVMDGVLSDASNNEAAGTASAEDSSAQATTAIDQFTGTNNQVSGVDEGDFVKTDGEYSYLLSGGYLVIIDSWPADQTHEVSRLKLEGSPQALFVKDDLLWVVSQLYRYRDSEPVQPMQFVSRSEQWAQVTMLDISQRDAPVVVRKVDFEGNYLDARRIDNQVYMVSTARLDLSSYLDASGELDMETLLPVFEDTKISGDSAQRSRHLISKCGQIFRPETANGTGTLSLISFDLADPYAELQRQSIISDGGQVYANRDHLYLAMMENEFWRWQPVMQEQAEQPIPGTTLHKFSLSGQPQYLASGRVDGYMLNQFSMDEQDDLLRIVTTSDAWWSDEPPQNSLFILQQNGGELTVRSKLGGLGKPGERIYSARFIGDQAFVVTFEQIDPLYTLDLSDPDAPRVAGELEVPGFSTYLHPIGDDLLLAIGRNPESGSVKLSLFDTHIFDQPELLHSEELGQGSNSEAEYSHKAFSWFAAEQTLALPVSRWRSVLAGDAYQYDVFNGLQLYQVDRDTGFQLRGSIDHSSFYQDDETRRWFYPEGIRRSFFIMDELQNSFVYSISARGLKVNALDDLNTDLAAVSLPAYDWQNIFLED